MPAGATFDLAISDLDKALAQKSDLLGALNGRGYAYNSKGDYDRAIADLDKAIALSKRAISRLSRNRGYSYLGKRELRSRGRRF